MSILATLKKIEAEIVRDAEESGNTVETIAEEVYAEVVKFFEKKRNAAITAQSIEPAA